MDELRGLRSVRLDKQRLLDALKANKVEHKKVYDEAIQGWHEAMRAAVVKALADIDERSVYHTSIFHKLPKPEDHTEEYDATINLIEWSLDTEFELQAQEFQQFVMDNWAWKAGFTATTSNYRNG